MVYQHLEDADVRGRLRGQLVHYLLKFVKSKVNTYMLNKLSIIRVNSGNFGHQVNTDTNLQTVEIQMRRLLMSHLIRIFTVCLVFFFIPIIKI